MPHGFGRQRIHKLPLQNIHSIVDIVFYPHNIGKFSRFKKRKSGCEMFNKDLEIVRGIVEETEKQFVPLSRIGDLLKEEGIGDCKIKVKEKKR